MDFDDNTDDDNVVVAVVVLVDQVCGITSSTHGGLWYSIPRQMHQSSLKGCGR